jgi:hypothetical protein
MVTSSSSFSRSRAIWNGVLPTQFGFDNIGAEHRQRERTLCPALALWPHNTRATSTSDRLVGRGRQISSNFVLRAQTFGL